MTFGEMLGNFKRKESVEACVVLMDDPSLRNGFLAWSSVRMQYKTPMPVCTEVDDVAQWDWLWEQVFFDKRKFGVVAGIKAQEVEPILIRLIGLRLVYPDGTQHELAQMYLRQELKKRLGLDKKQRQSKKETGRENPVEGRGDE